MDVAVAPRVRPWLIVALVLIAVKLGLTLLWIAWHHHVAGYPSKPVFETLWWITKVAPPIFIAALLLDARQIGSKVWTRVYAILLVITIVYGGAVTIAMLHGWKGTPL